MRDIVLDANVLVGLLDPHDSLHERSVNLRQRLETQGDRPVILDFLIEEAVSVLCRRAAQRRANPPALAMVRRAVDDWHDAGLIEPTPPYAVSLPEILDVVFGALGTLNCNDAKLILLQRQGLIDQVASFDSALGAFEGFACVS